MKLNEAKQILKKAGYLLSEHEDSQEIMDLYDNALDAIVLSLEKCKFLKGEIVEDQCNIRKNQAFITVYFPQTRVSTGPRSSEIQPQTIHFRYILDEDGYCHFDDGCRYGGGSFSDMIEYTVETIKELDKQLGWEIKNNYRE